MVAKNSVFARLANICCLFGACQLDIFQLKHGVFLFQHNSGRFRCLICLDHLHVVALKNGALLFQQLVGISQPLVELDFGNHQTGAAGQSF